jgi:hypothetical protein
MNKGSRIWMFVVCGSEVPERTCIAAAMSSAAEDIAEISPAPFAAFDTSAVLS